MLICYQTGAFAVFCLQSCLDQVTEAGPVSLGLASLEAQHVIEVTKTGCRHPVKQGVHPQGPSPSNQKCVFRPEETPAKYVGKTLDEGK